LKFGRNLAKKIGSKPLMTKLRIGILFGGRSGEHDVSLNSAQSILQAIDRDKYEVVQLGITRAGRWVGGDNPLLALQSGDQHAPQVLLSGDPSTRELLQLDSQSPASVSIQKLAGLDVVFPVLHGTYGEDGTLQGLLEMADLAYVGSGVAGSAVGMDKALFKGQMQAAGIAVLPWQLVLRSQWEEAPLQVLARLEAHLRYPMFVKPCNLGSSVGISKAKNRTELQEALHEAAKWDRRLVVEQGINAREIELSVLGNDQPIASLPGEVRPRREFYDYVAKYVSDDSELIIPAELSAEQVQHLQQMAVQAFCAIDAAGLARADFLLDKDSGEIWVNELNTLPGFTRISMYPKLWQASGISYPELIDRLIALALERKAERDRTTRVFSQSSESLANN
jgi:D-alanine-D-alanine ligase